MTTIVPAYHACPGGCGAIDVKASQFACRRCWWRVPAPLRGEVWRSYHQRGAPGGRLAHAHALLAAKRWLDQHPSNIVKTNAPATVPTPAP